MRETKMAVACNPIRQWRYYNREVNGDRGGVFRKDKSEVGEDKVVL